MMKFDENKIRKQIYREIKSYQRKKAISEKIFSARKGFTKQRLDSLVWLSIKNTLFSFILFSLGVILFDIEFGSKSSYEQILTCVATAGPVIMGLYFTVLTFVSTSTHKNLPPKVQNILLNEGKSNRCLNLLMIMSVTSLMLIVSCSLWNIIIKGMSFVSWVLFTVALACFVVLSRELFSYLDPKSWFVILRKKIEKYFKEIAKVSVKKINGTYCENLALKAREYTEYFEIVYNKVEKNSSSRDLCVLSEYCVGMLVSYQMQKRKIHPENEWFFIRTSEKKLYTENDHDFKFASKTMYQPVKSVNDFFWFEDKIEKVYVKIIAKIQEKGENDFLKKTVGCLNAYLVQLILNGFPERAFVVVKKMWAAFEERLHLNSDDTNVNTLSELYDLSIQMMLFSQYVCDFEFFRKKVNARKLLKYEFVFSGQYEQFLLKDLAMLSDMLNYEKGIEGCVITPSDFLAEEVSLKFHNFYLDYFDQLSNQMISFFISKKDVVKNIPKLEALAIKKEFEYWAKWDYGIKKVLIERDKKISLNLFRNVKKINYLDAEKNECNEKRELYYALIVCLENFESIQDEKMDIAGFSLNQCRLGLIDMVDDENFNKYWKLIDVFVKASVKEFIYLIKCGEKIKCYNPIIDLMTALGWLFILFELQRKTNLLCYLNGVCNEIFKKMAFFKIPLKTIVEIQNEYRIYRDEVKQEWNEKALKMLSSNFTNVNVTLLAYLKQKSGNAFNWNDFDGYDLFIAKNLMAKNYLFRYNFRQKGVYRDLKRMGLV